MPDTTFPAIAAQECSAFVYVLADPREPDSVARVRYVGVTTKSLDKRLRGHLERGALARGTHRACWLNKLMREGVRPLIELVEETTLASGLDREIEWIAEYRRRGCDLTNSTAGGRGLLQPTAETRRKMSAALVGNRRGEGHMRVGYVHSLETRKKISMVGTGRRLAPETRAKIGESLKGRRFAPEALAKMSAAKKGKAGRKQAPDTRAKLSRLKRGERNGVSRVTQAQVDSIRSEYRPRIVTLKMLGEEYGVSESNIWMIIHGRTWSEFESLARRPLEERADDNPSAREAGAPSGDC